MVSATCAVHAVGWPSIRARNSARSALLSSQPRMVLRPDSRATGFTTNRAKLVSTCWRLTGSPHHHVSTDANRNGWPSRCSANRGKKASIAGLSMTPLPNGFTMDTAPRRAASTKPGTPKRESFFSSSGSQYQSSTRRRITSTGSSRPSERIHTRPPLTVRSPPSTNGYPIYDAK